MPSPFGIALVTLLRDDVAQFGVGIVRLDTQQIDTPQRRSNGLVQNCFIHHVMIRRQKYQSCLRVLFEDGREGKQHAVARAAASWLNDQIARVQFIGNRLPPTFMLTRHNRTDAILGNEGSGTRQREIKQRWSAMQRTELLGHMPAGAGLAGLSARLVTERAKIGPHQKSALAGRQSNPQERRR